MESSPEPASHPLGLPLQPHPAGEGREVREGEGGEHQPTAQHCPGGGVPEGAGGRGHGSQALGSQVALLLIGPLWRPPPGTLPGTPYC